MSCFLLNIEMITVGYIYNQLKVKDKKGESIDSIKISYSFLHDFSWFIEKRGSGPMTENYDRISAERFFENNPKWFEYISE